MEKININKSIDILNVVICIAAKDGILSSTELNVAKNNFYEFFMVKVTDEMMKQIVVDFFSSNKQIEDYLEKIVDEELKKLTLRLSLISAVSDGFDIKENIAYQKALIIWNISHDEVVLKNG